MSVPCTFFLRVGLQCCPRQHGAIGFENCGYLCEIQSCPFLRSSFPGRARERSRKYVSRKLVVFVHYELTFRLPTSLVRRGPQRRPRSDGVICFKNCHHICEISPYRSLRSRLPVRRYETCLKEAGNGCGLDGRRALRCAYQEVCFRGI